MDVDKLVEVLRATLDPNQQQQAEQQLNEIHKIIGFAPILLQVVMSDTLDMPVRQAGAIYLKNMVAQFWMEREVDNPGDPVPFSIHEQDRAAIRENIVEAIIFAPDPIRVQLTVCISNIIKHDFPGRWPTIPDKIMAYLQSDNAASWLGALIVLYQLVKNYEYKKPEERSTLTPVMQVLLPVIHERCVHLLPDHSHASHLLQKQILKIFYALIQYTLPMELITKPIFTQWMELVRQVVDMDTPETYHSEIDEDERPELPWWKCKKWALHILSRVFERYGSPGNVQKEYNQFSEWYLKSFSGGILNVILKLLHTYQQKRWVAPRVLQQALNYINQAISHAFSWKFIKPHMQTIIQEVLFPLMCHSDEDDELWNCDPHEYIRTKFDIFEEFLSPITAAQTVLHSAVAKRKEVLQKCMGFCMQMMSTSTTNTPRQKDGALHMVGAVADVLLKRKIYKSQAETMLVNHVFPEFQSPHGFLRARACWAIRYFAEVQFKSDPNLVKALQLVQACLCSDKDLPVRVEAAIALQMLISEQERAQDHMRPYVKAVVLEMLSIIRETENDDLTNVLQKLVCTYVDDIPPIAVEMTQHLATTFGQIIQSESGESDEKAIAAMGVLNTIDTILTVVEDHKEIIAQLEGIVLQVVGITLQQNVLEFYEEILSLIYSLTMGQISTNMWQVFGMLYEMFQKEGFDYFTDMMPALHNYITVDTPAFLSNSKHVEIIYNMAKTVMTSDSGEDAECHAAKLLEVILLQCKGQVDGVLTTFIELPLERLTREIRTSELRTMCLQVVIAALYYNPPMTLDILEKMHLPNQKESITSQFLKQWLHDTDCFLGLHDRKISVLGLCALMDTPATRSVSVTEYAAEIIPSCILLFDGLKRAYESRAAEENDDDDDGDEDEDGEYDGGVLESDEDEIDEDGQQYLEKLERSANGEDDDSDAEYSDEGAEETALESYNTPLDADDCPVDEYQIFKAVLQNLQSRDPQWYNTLIGNLTQEQQEDLKKVIDTADKRQAAEESKKIEKGGGYNFTQTQVPSSFNFGS